MYLRLRFGIIYGSFDSPRERLRHCMSSEQQEEFQQAYQSGQAAFENGEYRIAVEYFQKAIALVSRNSRLGGEAQVWLVTAYEALGDRTAAINLCKQLTKHPHLETKKQGKRLLYILEAPQLVRPQSWMTEIPDLTNITDSSAQDRRGGGTGLGTKTSQAAPLPEKPVDLSQVNTKDNQFLILALGGAIALLLYLGWLGTT
jgi:tetratricopeptide (TPR) repeat protein